MRRRRARMSADPPELNLVPLLDMVSLLIQLMLINAQFGEYAELPSTAATPSAGHPEAGALALSIDVTRDGYEIAWTEPDGRHGEQLPCAATPCADLAAYDGPALTRLATDLKARFPAEKQVVIAPRPGVDFEVLIKTMDRLRGPVGQPLFPDAAFIGSRK